MKHATMYRMLVSLHAGLLLIGCSTITSQDRTAYEKATSAKAAAMVVMDKATESYVSKEAVVTPLLLEVDRAYEYDRGRSLNAETIEMWEILRAPDGNLFGGFLRRWKQKGSLKPDAIALKKPDIAHAFDQIIALEIGKRRTN